MKILSIAIPSYNMENYIENCLSSCLVKEESLLNKLEVIVVNDGSKDATSAIAHKYEKLYPGVFVVIDKNNGHYGSCINAALKVAKGKYFRILDADDWFDTDSLAYLIKALCENKIESDVVFTKHTIRIMPDDVKEENEYGSLIYGKEINLNRYCLPNECLKMHCLTYRLDLLKKISYTQTEGICYTDNEYVVIPMCMASTFYAFNISLYQYRMGRGEQSVSIKSIVNNVGHYLQVLENLLKVEVKNKSKDSVIRIPIIRRLYLICMDVFVLYSKPADPQRSQWKLIEDRVYKQIPSAQDIAYKRKIKGLPIYAIWHKYTRLYYSLLFPIIKQKVN